MYLVPYVRIVILVNAERDDDRFSDQSYSRKWDFITRLCRLLTDSYPQDSWIVRRCLFHVDQSRSSVLPAKWEE